jgi:hypothetical protein
MAGEDLEERKLRWEKTKFIATGVAGFAFFVIGLWQFNLTSRNDVAKPLLQKQLDLCIEASGAAAMLAPAPTDDSPPNKPRTTFLGLYYGKLAVVEDSCVYSSMVRFKTGVLDGQVRDHDASRAAITIAFACRRLLIKNWNAGLVGIYDPQHLTSDFSKLNDFKVSMNEIDGCKDSQ